MITTKNVIKGKISTKQKIIGKIGVNTLKVYPELENLEITPSATEQNFKSEKYGYDNVKVKAIESEELNIIPSTEIQIKEGMFNKVTVQGDENLVPENIAQNKTIFGVQGIAKVSNVKITDSSYLFYGGARKDYLYEILSLCENVVSASNMFASDGTIRELDLSNFDTSNVRDMSSMFYNCRDITELDLSDFDTSNVRDMSNMFNSCSSLTNLDISNFEITNVDTMSNMFMYCSELKELNLSKFGANKISNMSSMFGYCKELTDLNIGNLDMSKVTSITNIFYSCSTLTNLTFGENLGKGYTRKTNNYSSYKLDLSTCTQLTHDSLMSVINNLYDLNITYNVSNGGTLYRQSLVLGSTNLAKLTEEEIAIATNKGWNVS